MSSVLASLASAASAKAPLDPQFALLLVRAVQLLSKKSSPSLQFGTATLGSGEIASTATVGGAGSTLVLTANSKIYTSFLAISGGTQGAKLGQSAITTGTAGTAAFTITSLTAAGVAAAADTSTFNWLVVNLAKTVPIHGIDPCAVSRAAASAARTGLDPQAIPLLARILECCCGKKDRTCRKILTRTEHATPRRATSPYQTFASPQIAKLSVRCTMRPPRETILPKSAAPSVSETGRNIAAGTFQVMSVNPEDLTNVTSDTSSFDWLIIG